MWAQSILTQGASREAAGQIKREPPLCAARASRSTSTYAQMQWLRHNFFSVGLLQVIPRAVKAVFSSVQEAMKEYDIAIHVTFVEIYNDEVGAAAITWRPMIKQGAELP